MKFILGTKLGMTQIFQDDGRVIPVTRVQAGPCVVTKVSKGAAGTAVEVGYGAKKHLNKPEAGVRKGLPPVRFLRSFGTESLPESIHRGSVITVAMFSAGERVTVSGISKGRGFAGVVKRHGFAGSPKTHGHKDQLRMPGSIGATDAARVFKGVRMAGRMGADKITIANLEVVRVDPQTNELLIKGAVPGARGGLVTIMARGELQAVAPAAEKPEQEPLAKEEANIPADTANTHSPSDEPETQTIPAADAQAQTTAGAPTEESHLNKQDETTESVAEQEGRAPVEAPAVQTGVNES